MNVKFLPEARDELLEAVAYYEGEASGLGSRLWEEVDRHIAWIERNHEVPRLRPGGSPSEPRAVSLLHLVYRPRALIWILAIAHGHRRPEYWIDRPKAVP